MANQDYALAALADVFRQRREGHRALFVNGGREADRAYSAAYTQALHDLYTHTYGDHGEPLEAMRPQDPKPGNSPH